MARTSECNVREVATAKSTRTKRNEDRNLCLVSLTDIELRLRAYTPRCEAALRTPLV
jgi:hypothetical protein